MTGQTCKSFEEVFDEELNDVVQRRLIAGVNPPESAGDLDPPQEAVKDELVGVAMSGGGIRSATFCLGVLQSLYRNGILKHVDYLSTVSGGGYVGAMFSSLIARANRPVHWGAQSDNAEGIYRLPFETEKSGRQPDIVRRLLKHGSTLRQPIRFLSRHLWGLLLVNVFALSGLAAVASIAAYAFRTVYSREALQYLPELGFGTDLSIAFFPAALMFCLWIVSSVLAALLRMAGKNTPRWPQFFYVGLVVTFLMGIAGLMAMGDISLRKYESVFGLPPHVAERIRMIINWVTAGALSFFGIALVPYLNVRALLQSGSQSQSVLKNWIFATASSALVFGTPFVVFFILAHENISGHLAKREDAVSMCRSSITNWPGFWQTVEGQRPLAKDATAQTDANGQVGPGTPLGPPASIEVDKQAELAEFLYQVANSDKYALDGEPHITLDDKHQGAVVDLHRGDITHEIIILQDRIDEADRNTWFFERWIAFASFMIGDENSEFKNGLADRKKRDRLRDVVTNRINQHCLSNPRFVNKFEGSGRDKRKTVAPGSEYDQKLLAASEDIVKALQDANREVSQYDRARNGWIAEGQHLSSMFDKHFDKLPDPNNADMAGRMVVEAIAQARKDLGLKKDTVAIGRSEDRRKAREAVAEARHKLSRLESIARRIRENNWNLLASEYPLGDTSYIRPIDTVFAIVVNDADQKWRLRIAGISLLIFVFLGVVVNLNSTSLHGFYRDQLEQVWIGSGPQLLLKDLKTVARGGPIHVFNGTNNLLARHGDRDVENMSMFHFTSRYCGTRRMRYRATSEYCQGDLSVADVMAISGAAVTATIRTTLLFKLILVLTNFRLGRWLPMPKNQPGDIKWPSPLRLSMELMMPPENRSFCFVSDGGHLENTGIGSLMMRRCRVIIAVDGTYDPDSQYEDFVKQVRNARWKYGVQVTSIVKLEDGSWKPLDVATLLGDKETGISKSHFVVARIQYPERFEEGDSETVDHDPLDGYLIYVKPALTGDEPIELQKYRETCPEFPHDPTLDQFFEPVRFESYRQLGEHAGDSVVAELMRTKGDQENWLAMWNPIESHGGAPTAITEVTLEDLKAPLTNRVINDLMKKLDSTDELGRERIYGHLGDQGESLGSRLRRKIAVAIIARHASETKPLQARIEKVLSTIGEGISQVDEFLRPADTKPRRAPRGKSKPAKSRSEKET